MIEGTDRPILRGECAVAGSAARGQNAQRPAEPVTMLAYARLGVVIHSQVFGGFSGNACGTRIAGSGRRILITMDRYYRAGDLADHMVKADEVVAEARRQGHDVDKVVVGWRHPGRYASKTLMVGGRDHFVNEIIADYAGRTAERLPGRMPARICISSVKSRDLRGDRATTGTRAASMCLCVEKRRITRLATRRVSMGRMRGPAGTGRIGRARLQERSGAAWTANGVSRTGRRRAPSAGVACCASAWAGRWRSGRRLAAAG